MYAKSAAVYDALYLARGKDYAAEAAAVHALIQQRKRSDWPSLLDVGCGTGGHLAHFARWYAAEGLDLSAEMLAAAREKCPAVPLHRGDMADFDLGRTFDAVVCLFSSIGYVRTREGLERAVQAMARHLRPGGVLAVEPWLSPADVGRGGMGLTAADEPGLKVARIFANRVEGRLLVMDWHFLVGTPEGVETFTERHETGLFTPDEYLSAFDAAGVHATDERDPAIERGLYVRGARSVVRPTCGLEVGEPLARLARLYPLALRRGAPSGHAATPTAGRCCRQDRRVRRRPRRRGVGRPI